MHIGGSVGAIGLSDKASSGGGESDHCTARFLMSSIAWCVFGVICGVVLCCVVRCALEVYGVIYSIVW
jgi:hypothetical protein